MFLSSRPSASNPAKWPTLSLAALPILCRAWGMPIVVVGVLLERPRRVSVSDAHVLRARHGATLRPSNRLLAVIGSPDHYRPPRQCVPESWGQRRKQEGVALGPCGLVLPPAPVR